MAFDLTFVWAMLLAAAVFFYVVMDGFDLGIGILFPWIHAAEERDVMVNTIAPFWDGNETWLVLGGGGLMAVFPLAYAVMMSALYMPLLIMLLALVFRGVSFEMRFKARTQRGRLFWDRAFSWGSYVAGGCQGMMLGALVQGIHVEGRMYAGGWWDWFTPFSLFTSAAVVLGYGLLGACWLVWKTEGALQDKARHLAWYLGVAILICIALVSLIMPFLQPGCLQKWLAFPHVMFTAQVPLLVLLLAWRFFVTLKKTAHPAQTPTMWGDSAPFLCGLGLFLLSYIGLGINMWPMIVPPSITIAGAAASYSSQRFLFTGAVILIPIILGYTAFVYWVFRGKISAHTGYH